MTKRKKAQILAWIYIVAFVVYSIHHYVLLFDAFDAEHWIQYWVGLISFLTLMFSVFYAVHKLNVPDEELFPVTSFNKTSREEIGYKSAPDKERKISPEEAYEVIMKYERRSDSDEKAQVCDHCCVSFGGTTALKYRDATLCCEDCLVQYKKWDALYG